MDARQPLRPRRRARQRDPGGYRLRRVEGRQRVGRRHARLACARTADGCAFDPRGRQPDRLRLAAAGRRPGRRGTPVADARPLGGTRRGAGGARRQSRHAAGRRRPRGRRLRVAAHPLAPGDRQRSTWLGGQRPQAHRVASAPTRSSVRQWILRPARRARSAASPTRSTGAPAPASARRPGSTAPGAGTAGTTTRSLWVDTLLAQLAVRRYRLEQPVDDRARRLGAGRSARSSLRALDGSSVRPGRGQGPGTAPGDLRVQVLGLDLHDLYGLLQRDTLGVAGDARARPAGGRHRRGADASAGIAALADGRFGDFQSPFVQGVVNYADRRLDANLDLWRTGRALLQVEAHLPLDLALTRRRRSGRSKARSPCGPARDSVALGHARGADPGGHAASAARSRPTCRSKAPGSAPRLDGQRERSATAACRCPGSVCGSAACTGGAAAPGRLDRAARRAAHQRRRQARASAARSGSRTSSRPVLDLDFRADQFRAIDVRSFLTLVATGDLQLRGPVFGADPHRQPARPTAACSTSPTW